MSESTVCQASVTSVDSQAPVSLPRMKAFAPYEQGKSVIPGRDSVIKLSSNEGCFGPSARALAAYHAAASTLHRYPDGSQTALREAIASVHGLNADRIVCGNGSEEVIGLLIRCYVGEGEELLLSENHFVMCSIYGTGQGASITLAPEQDFTVHVDAVLERITPKTRVISIANPNNPTGTYLPVSEMERLVHNVPERVLLIIDGAYAEYVDRDDFDEGFGWVDQRTNVVVTRTFSKIHGLAGMRIGWSYGPAAVIEIVNRLRTPFNTNAPALAAAAAALGDRDHVERSRAHVAQWQQRIARTLCEFGLAVVPSVTNFYLLDFEPVNGKTAIEAAAFLESHGIIPRPGHSDRFLRITVGTDAENEAVLDSLARYLAS
jgi:histidinol-phosphate aminotransferase